MNVFVVKCDELCESGEEFIGVYGSFELAEEVIRDEQRNMNYNPRFRYYIDEFSLDKNDIPVNVTEIKLPDNCCEE